MSQSPVGARKGGRPQSFTDEQVFQAITGIIVEHGIGAVSMPAIARRIGFSHQAVTFRFSTREKMLNAYAAWYQGSFLSVEQRLRMSGRPALDILLEFLMGGGVDAVTGVPALGGPVEPIKLMMEFDREPILRRYFAPGRSQTFEWVTELIAQAQAEARSLRNTIRAMSATRCFSRSRGRWYSTSGISRSRFVRRCCAQSILPWRPIVRRWGELRLQHLLDRNEFETSSSSVSIMTGRAA
ncbi:MAG: TetR/AcrR family transcriptional regulator [Thermomicrobiales bacterium]